MWDKVSKATKKAKHQRRVAPKVRRGAHGLKKLRPNPALDPSLDFVLDAAVDMTLLSLLKACGIHRIFKKALLGGDVSIVLDGNEFEGAEGAD